MNSCFFFHDKRGIETESERERERERKFADISLRLKASWESEKGSI